MSLSNPTNPPLVNEHAATPVSTGVVFAVDENQSKINQLHGINPAGSVGAGIPKPVSNVGASVSNGSVGSTCTVNITFQRDPSDNNFAGVTIYVKGYQGNNAPVQVGASADSPCTVILNNTGEPVILIVQSVGNGGVSPITTSPTCAIKLPKNSNGGYGTQTTTNLTLAQIPSTPAGSLVLSSLTTLSTGGSQGPAVNLDTEGSFDWWTINPNTTTPANCCYPNAEALVFACANRGSFGRFRTQLFCGSGGADALSTAGSPAFASTTVSYASNQNALIMTAGSSITGVSNNGISLTSLALVSVDPNIPFGGWLAWIPLPTGRSTTVNVHFALRACTATLKAILLDGSNGDITVTQTGISGGSSGTWFNFYRATFTVKSNQYLPMLFIQILETAGVAGLVGNLALPAITLS